MKLSLTILAACVVTAFGQATWNSVTIGPTVTPVTLNSVTNALGFLPQPTNSTLTSISTNSTSGTGVIPLQSVVASAVSGIYQPWDLSKTYMVMLGDSNGQFSDPDYSHIALLTLPWWSGLKFYTNESVGGQSYVDQTNAFYSHALQFIPASASNGTNVIVTYFVGNDWIVNTYDTNILYYTQFFGDLKARGYTVVVPTIPDRTLWNSTTRQSLFSFRQWLIQQTNLVDIIPDFYSAMPDGNNTNWYSDGTHLTMAAQANAGMIWEKALREKTRTPALPFVLRGQAGTRFVSTNGTQVASIDDAGIFYPVKVQMASTSTSKDMLQLINSGTYGHDFYVGNTASGTYNVWDNTSSSDVFTIRQNPWSLTNSATTRVFKLAVNGTSAVGGQIFYTINATDSVESQGGSGVVGFVTSRKGGTAAIVLNDGTHISSCSSGTLTWTVGTDVSGADLYFTITPTTSLGGATMNVTCTVVMNSASGGLISNGNQ